MVGLGYISLGARELLLAKEGNQSRGWRNLCSNRIYKGHLAAPKIKSLKGLSHCSEGHCEGSDHAAELEF